MVDSAQHAWLMQDVLARMPELNETVRLGAAAVAGGVGLLLWLAGARAGRGLLALSGVAAGGVLGLFLARRGVVPLSGMGSAVIGAVVVGAALFVMHRFAAGILLGLVASLWAGVICFDVYNGEATWVWPEVTEETVAADYARSVWASLPDGFRGTWPVVAVGSSVAGIVLTFVLPRLTLRLAWSAAGTTLLIVGGWTLAQRYAPSMIDAVPPQWTKQLIVALAFVAAGAALQWWVTAKPPKRSKKKVDVQSIADAKST